MSKTHEFKDNQHNLEIDEIEIKDENFKDPSKSNNTIEKQLEPENINASIFESYLTTSGIPDPELLIRTSGELRISNFLMLKLSLFKLNDVVNLF